MIVEHSFGMWIVHIHRIRLELCLMEKKKEEEIKKKKNKIEIFMFNFIDSEEKSWDSRAILDIRIGKGFHFLSLASLHCVYLGAAPIP